MKYIFVVVTFLMSICTVNSQSYVNPMQNFYAVKQECIEACNKKLNDPFVDPMEKADIKQYLRHLSYVHDIISLQNFFEFEIAGVKYNSITKTITVEHNISIQSLPIAGEDPPTQEEILANLERQKQQQFQLSKQEQQRKEILAILNEVSQYEPVQTIPYYQAPEYIRDTKPFYEAFSNLKDMLEGKTPLSLRDAYYIYEGSFENCYLSYSEYTGVIDESVRFIRQWLKENNFSVTNNEVLHYGIQKFMRDTLYVNFPTWKMHLPFVYDFTDYAGSQDFRNQHVTKTLATGTGQCHTLPVTYLLLAEGLGAKCYLTYAPYHSFIKYPSNKGEILNYEPTSFWSISDQWYSEDLMIKAEAIRSGIYLDTLNTRMIVAACIIDLGFWHNFKFGVGDGTFITECSDYGLNYFPGKEANIMAQLQKGNVVAVKLHRLLTKSGVGNVDRMNTVPGATELYNELMVINQTIERLGHQEVPAEVFNALVEEHEIKRSIQNMQGINTKAKRNLFVTN